MFASVVRRLCASLIMTGFTLLLPAAGSMAAGPRDLTAPALYAGKLFQEGESCRIFLYLGIAQGFLLREETALSNGKLSTWEAAGKWRQIRGGAFLQLTSEDGFYRTMNVGGAGDLYYSVQLPDGIRGTVALQVQEQGLAQKEDSPFNSRDGNPAFALSGMLRAKGTKYALEDEDNGVSYPVAGGELVVAFLQKHAPDAGKGVFVQASVVVEAGKGSPDVLRVTDLRIVPAKKLGMRDLTNYFLDAVAGSPWRVTRLDQKTPAAVYMLSFLPDRGSRDGKLELFDGTGFLTGAYTMTNTRLSLSANTADPGMAELIRQTRSWKLAGEVLELWDETRVLALLEKAR